MFCAGISLNKSKQTFLSQPFSKQKSFTGNFAPFTFIYRSLTYRSFIGFEFYKKLSSYYFFDQLKTCDMKASTERKIIRWIHILLSIPVIGYIYGPVAQIPGASMMVRIFFFPAMILSGFYLWKGHLLKKWLRSTIEDQVYKRSTGRTK